MSNTKPADTLGGMVNGFDGSAIDSLSSRAVDIVHRRQRSLGPAYKLFYQRPVEFVRGDGIHLFDAEGQRYLDAYNNVTSVGHCNARVVEAVTAQVATLNTNTRYLDRGLVAYAERLLGTHDPALQNAMFTCTGSEAIDLALRVTRFATGRQGVIVTTNAYHGITTAASEISPSLGRHVALAPEVRVVPAPTEGVPEMSDRFAADVRAAVEDLDRHGHGIAALVVDTVFSSDGLRPDPAGFLRPAVEIVQGAGGVFVADEVQPGFARTGDAFWGYQRHGVHPDIAVMGKPMGNGMPIAGIAARPELLREFGELTRYFNTFGGNTVSVAAAAAVLDVILEDDLMANSRDMGARMLDGIRSVFADDAGATGIRGAGLYAAVDIVDPETGAPSRERATALVNCMRDRNVLISATGPEGSTLKVRPPLIATPGDIDTLLDALDDTVAALR